MGSIISPQISIRRSRLPPARRVLLPLGEVLEAMKCVAKRRSIVEVVVLSIVHPRHRSELDRMISSEKQENV